VATARSMPRIHRDFHFPDFLAAQGALMR